MIKWWWWGGQSLTFQLGLPSLLSLSLSLLQLLFCPSCWLISAQTQKPTWRRLNYYLSASEREAVYKSWWPEVNYKPPPDVWGGLQRRLNLDHMKKCCFIIVVVTHFKTHCILDPVSKDFVRQNVVVWLNGKLQSDFVLFWLSDAIFHAV